MVPDEFFGKDYLEGCDFMKNTELLKKVACVCTALVLMHVALLDVTAAVQPDNLANAARQIQNNKLYTDSTPCIV